MHKQVDLNARLSADPDAQAKIIYNTYPGGYRLHRHAFYEFSLATSGECLHIINGEPYHFRAGDICLLSPANLHQFLPIEGAEPLTMYTVSFSPEPIRTEFWAHLPADLFPLSARLDEETFSSVRRAFQKLYKRASTEKLPFDLFTQTALEWVILNIMDLSDAETSTEFARIRPALIFIQGNFSEPITLADAADTVFFSREYFSSLFRKTMGVSFQQYLLDLRMEYAANLLALTTLSITEVSLQSGFQTLSYFIRAFSKKYSVSPGAFREEKRAAGIKPLPLMV